MTTLYLSGIHIMDKEPESSPWFGPGGGGYFFVPGNVLGIPNFSKANMGTLLGGLNSFMSASAKFLKAVFKPVKDKYESDHQVLAQSVEGQLATVRPEFGTNTLPPIEAVKRELVVRSALVTRTISQFEENTRIANTYFGTDPLTKNQPEIAFKAFKNFLEYKTPVSDSLASWERSYRAAYAAKLNADTVSMLNAQHASVQSFLSALQHPDNKNAVVWAEIRAWGDKLTARRTPIVTKHASEKASLESRVQNELDARNQVLGPLPQQTAEQWVARALLVVDELVKSKMAALRPLSAALGKYPGVDFKASDLKGFLERARDGKLSSEAAFEKEVALINTAHKADLLLGEIQSLEDRLPALHTAQAHLDNQYYEKSLSFLADTNQHIFQQFGAEFGKIATGLQSNISGKKIKSYNDAMVAFERVKANPKFKLSAKDTSAVVRALEVLDKATFADNLNRLGRAFGVTGKVIQANNIRLQFITGYKTGDWKPLGLELESMIVGMAAGAAVGAVAAVMIAFLGGTAMISIPVAALAMAATAAYFSPEVVDELNSLVF